jgi:hypothetical protein
VIPQNIKIEALKLCDGLDIGTASQTDWQKGRGYVYVRLSVSVLKDWLKRILERV